jgi:predicted peroxiredoxin
MASSWSAAAGSTAWRPPRSELGGKLLVCGPCIKSRGIAPDDLIEGAEIVAAGRFIAEITSATNSLVY